MKKLSTKLLVISGIVCAWERPALGDTVRRVDIIDGQQYTVEYTARPDGSLSAVPVAQWINGGWEYLSPTAKKVDGARVNTRLVTNVNGRIYAVQFSGRGNSLAGEPYAIDDNGAWKYLSAPAEAKKDPGTSKTKASVPVAEFRMFERALDNYGVTFHETTGFSDDGNWVQPDLSARATLRAQDGANVSNFAIDIAMSGTAVTTGTDGKRKATGAHVSSSVNAQISRDVTATPTSLTPGQLRSDITMTITDVDSFTQKKFLKGLRERVAGKVASKQAHGAIPTKKAQLRAEVEASTRAALNETTRTLQDGIKQVSEITDLKSMPFSTKLSSQAGGPRGGTIGASLQASDGVARAERPPVERPQQMATSLFLHEDALNDAIRPQFAGKQINIREAMAIICAHKITRKLSFCTERPKDEEPMDADLLFDKDRPFAIHFKNNQVTIELNAVHAVNFGAEKTDAAKVHGNPYRIEVTYDVAADRLDRKSVKIEERPQSFSEKDVNRALVDPTHAAGLLFGRAARYIASPKEKQTLQEEYEKAFQQHVEFPKVSLPTQFHAENPKAGGEPRMTGAATFVPLEALAKDGWFGATMLLCGPGMGAVGITYDFPKQTNQNELLLTSVVPGSPASFLGLQKGDRITAFRAVGDAKATPIAGDPKTFEDKVAAAAKEEEATKRMMTLAGVSGTGAPFSLIVSLCPTGLDHLAEAAKTLEKLRKL